VPAISVKWAGDKCVAPPGLAVSAVRFVSAKALIPMVIVATVATMNFINFISSSLIVKLSFSPIAI
jgi:hypothetical protein